MAEENGASAALVVTPPSAANGAGLGAPHVFDDLVRWFRSLGHRDDLDGAEVLHFGSLRLDPCTREVRRARRKIELTPIEFNLLELFLNNPNRVLSRALIFRSVWGFDFGVMSNSLNVYVGNLRRKTEAAGEPRLIYTIRGVGYILREPAGRHHRR